MIYTIQRMRMTISFVMLTCLCFLFAACSDSDSNEMDKSELTSKLKQHKWILRESEFNMYSQTELELRSDTHYLYFISDSEGVELTITKIDDTFDELGHSLDRDYSYFNYYVDGNKVYLNYELSGYKNLVYENGVLNQDKDVVWYPSALNSSERDEMNRLMEEKGYKSDFNFDFSIGFDNKSPLSYTVYDTRTGTYTHSILWGFGVPSNTYARGITSFGIALTTDDGTVDTGTGRSEEASVSTHNIGSYRNVRCFMGTLTDNSEHWWNTRITISSKKKTISLKYTCIFYAGKNPSYDKSHFSLDSQGYVYANSFNYESYSPTRIVDQNGNVVDAGGNDEQGQGSSSGLTSCPDANHPHVIDLGLPSGTKWACCNVGASAPEQYGKYYAWGETSPKSVYNFSTYLYGSILAVANIGSDIGGTDYDAATVNWGAPWRMPSLTQIQEVLNNCSSTWISQNGVKGRKFVGSNGGIIFIPAAGECLNDELTQAGAYGRYWSSTLIEGNPYNAYEMSFYPGSAGWSDGSFKRSFGLSVRPVR